MMEVSGERTIVNVDFQTTQSVRRRLKAEDAALYESWFAKLVEDKRTELTLTLGAPNGLVAQYIETHFTKKSAQAVDAEMPTPDGMPRRITLTV